MSAVWYKQHLNLKAHRREKKSRTWKDMAGNEDFYFLPTDFRLPPSNTSSNTIALTAKILPAMKVAFGLIVCHKIPPNRLAGKSATPIAKLINPKAVPRRWDGTLSATSANNMP
jgi:hypothetical protein